MNSKFYVIIFFFLPTLLFAQSHHVNVAVSSFVHTSNGEINSVIKLWESYLNSKPDSNYTNPYWVKSEQDHYHPFDLVGHAWWNPSLYFYMKYFKIQVLSVSKYRDVFIIRTMFYISSPKDSCQLQMKSIIQTAAQFENGSYKLCNILPINTRFWQKEEVGSVKFVFPPDHVFNRSLAEQMSGFIDSLASFWQLKTFPTEYYFSDDDRAFKALGFDYWLVEENIIGGWTDTDNHIVYAKGSNEWYPHEFVHIYINPLFPNANDYFLEGYATLMGGSAGHDLLWHIRRNFEYLKDHPEIDVLSFKGVDKFVPAQYFIGGLLCKMAEEQGGLPLLKKLMSYGNKDEDLYRAIHDVFGVSKDGVNKFLRTKLEEFAKK